MGVGIRNVRDRLRLIYADCLRFEIVNEEGKGTKVLITLPLIYAEDELS